MTIFNNVVLPAPFSPTCKKKKYYYDELAAIKYNQSINQSILTIQILDSNVALKLTLLNITLFGV